MIPAAHVYLLAAALFVLGMVGFLRQRNALLVLMSIELMINSANLTFLAAAREHGDTDGLAMPLFLIVVAAAEAAIGLSLFVVLFRRRGSLDVAAVGSLKD